MNSPSTSSGIPTKNVLRIVIGTLIILAIPLLAMQFNDEVRWDLADFIIIGVLLIVAGLTYELIARQLKSRQQRIILAVVFIVAILVAWVEMAVGIFD